MLPKPDVFAPDGYRLNMIYGRQQEALRINEEAKKNFEQQSADWIKNNTHNRTIGQPLSAKPLMPKELVVEDNGTERWKAFEGMKEPELDPEQAPPPRGPGFMGGGLQAPPMDRTDFLIEMLRALNEKMDKILAAKG